jgi:hypothetical protein
MKRPLIPISIGVRQRFKSIYWRYRSFAFFKEVYEKLSSTIENFEDLDLDHKIIISFVFLLSPNYFNYANKPREFYHFINMQTVLLVP